VLVSPVGEVLGEDVVAGALFVEVDTVGEPLVGREAISTPLAGKPVKVEVPPGRYWPAGAEMRTVAAEEGAAAGVELAGAEAAFAYLSAAALTSGALAIGAATGAAGGAAAAVVAGGDDAIPPGGF
jgi:hypothetical protein